MSHILGAPNRPIILPLQSLHYQQEGWHSLGRQQIFAVGLPSRDCGTCPCRQPGAPVVGSRARVGDTCVHGKSLGSVTDEIFLDRWIPVLRLTVFFEQYLPFTISTHRSIQK